MKGRKPHEPEVYGTYEPYPVSRRGESHNYPQDTGPPGEMGGRRMGDSGDADAESSYLVGDSGPTDWSMPTPPRSGTGRPGALAILGSLFADRLGILQAALRELETAEEERRSLGGSALEDIDSRIRECENALRVFRRERALNDLERRKHLERQLLELKRQRHHEAVLSWRDVLSLRRETMTLQREIASVTGTVSSADKPRAGRDDDE